MGVADQQAGERQLLPLTGGRCSLQSEFGVRPPTRSSSDSSSCREDSQDLLVGNLVVPHGIHELPRSVRGRGRVVAART